MHSDRYLTLFQIPMLNFIIIIIKIMEPTQFKELKMMMLGEAESTFLLDTIVLIHALNLEAGLECINEEDEKCQYPTQWSKHKEGVYKLNYKLKQGKQDQVLQFRFVDMVDALSVNFVPQGSDQLYGYQLTLQETRQSIIQKHKTQLNKIVQNSEPKVKEPMPKEPIYLQPVRREPPVMERPVNPLLIPPGQQPVGNPFGRGQYVGPDSEIFNRGGQNPQRIPFPTGGRGGRYDPVDPFGLENPKGDFNGFDEFGRPKGGFGGGFGGGLGGGFGGFNGSNNFM